MPAREVEHTPTADGSETSSPVLDSSFGRWSLPRRVLLVNVGVLLAAAVGLILTPATVSDPVAPEEVLVVAGGIVLLVLANLVLLRRAFAPLRRLAEVMAQVDYMHPGLRLPEHSHDPDMARLTQSFNDMLDHLESERVASFRRTTEAQEDERRRVSRELHDEVGQSLTALKLALARAGGRATSPELAEAVEITDHTLTEVRNIARRLRPDVLDEFGLGNALRDLATRNAGRAGLRIEHEIASGLPKLDPTTELTVYRIAQEALTNVMRHSGASRASVHLGPTDGRLVLVIRDDGRGLGTSPGNGIKGMNERALLVGGSLSLRNRREGGAEVELCVPWPE